MVNLTTQKLKSKQLAISVFSGQRVSWGNERKYFHIFWALLSTLYTVGESQGKHHQWREGLCLSCRFLRMTHQTCNKTSDFYCSNGVPTWHLGASTTKKWESQGKHHQWDEGLCLSCWFLPYDPPENHFQLDDHKKSFF